MTRALRTKRLGRGAFSPAVALRPAQGVVSLPNHAGLKGLRHKITVAVILVAVSVSARGRAAESPAQDLARAVQHKYDGIKDFSADFVHTYRGGVLRKEIVERGRLLVKKPGKMRWEYRAPEEKLFVSDGVKLYSYLPLDKQVYVSSVPRDDRATTPALFLAGKGDLTRDFSCSLAAPPTGASRDTRALKLVPLSPQRDYDWIVLEVGAERLDLRGLVTTDAQGGQSSFAFTSLKENSGLTDKTFTFSIPRGVDVVTDASSR